MLARGDQTSLDARGEVAAYYDELATAFGVTIDVVGPVFGNEALLAEIADSSDLATLVGETAPPVRHQLHARRQARPCRDRDHGTNLMRRHT